MTKKVIKEALEACAKINSPCNICPYKHVENCYDTLKNDALVLITEQEREIERLKAEVKQAQIDVLNKLKKKTHNYYPSIDSYCISQHVVLVRDIDELINKIENDYGDMADSVHYLTVDMDDFDDFIDELIKEVQNGEDKG